MLKRKEFILGAAAGLIVAAGATAGGVISWPGAHAETRPGQIVASAGAAGLAFSPPQGAPLSFADIVAQVAPAVVQIEVETPVERPAGGMQIPGLPPGFIIPSPQGQADPDAEPQLAQGAGSGFFISADGFIVTNNHVVANAKSIKVKMSDGRTMDATLVGRDESTDLAVIKVEGSDFKFVSFEEQADPRVGDWVVAVGNPFGLGGTATAGIVSARGRDIGDNSTPYTDYLQIDAAINRGNSGGPTFDIYGRVIGVNSAIFSPTGGSVGIGFAIPASTAKTITDRLVRGETIQRGYLGVQIGSLEPYRESLNLPDDAKGAFVVEITHGGPAERGGLQPGDIVTSINGSAVESSTDLTRKVAETVPGDQLSLEIMRDGRNQTVTVRSGTRPSNAELVGQDSTEADPAAPPALSTGQVVAGLNLAPISSALRERYNIPANINGVIVTDIATGGDRRFQPGFVIMRAGNAPAAQIDAVQAAVEAARAANRSTVFLLVWTPQGNQPVLLRLPKAD